MPHSPEAENFLSAVLEVSALWRSVDLRVLAVRRGDTWSNLLTRCYLDARKASDVTRHPDLPMTESIGCWQIVQPLDALKFIVEGVDTGQLKIEGVEIDYLRYPQSGASGDPTPYGLNPHLYSDITSPYHFRIWPYWSCLWLSAYGYSMHTLLQSIPGGQTAVDNMLRTLRQPFDGLDGLAHYVIGLPEPLKFERNASFEILAPLEARLRREGCNLEQGRVRVTIEAGSEVAAQYCKLGAFGVGKGILPFRGSFDLPKRRWDATAQRWLIEGEFEVPDAQVLTLLLGLLGHSVDRADFVDSGRPVSNRRINSYALVDPRLDVFWRWLEGDGEDRGKDFERAVARLLMFCGYQVDLLAGVGRLSEWVDIIAHSPSSQTTLLVECTMGSIQGKPGKLMQRLGATREAVQEQESVAVLVTTSKRAHLSPSELEAAARDEIAVICAEDLIELYTLGTRGSSPQDALDYIKARIGEKPADG